MVYLKLLAVMFFWGGTFVAGRVIGDNLAPTHTSFLRFLLSSVLLLGLVWYHEKHFPIPKLREWLFLALMGVTGIALYNIFFFYGLTLIEANRGSLITAINPLYTAVIAAFLFGEKLTPVRIAGLLLCLAGVSLIITKGDYQATFNQGVG